MPKYSEKPEVTRRQLCRRQRKGKERLNATHLLYPPQSALIPPDPDSSKGQTPPCHDPEMDQCQHQDHHCDLEEKGKGTVKTESKKWLLSPERALTPTWLLWLQDPPGTLAPSAEAVHTDLWKMTTGDHGPREENSGSWALLQDTHHHTGQASGAQGSEWQGGVPYRPQLSTHHRTWVPL